jgi:hypothetical protein
MQAEKDAVYLRPPSNKSRCTGSYFLIAQLKNGLHRKSPRRCKNLMCLWTLVRLSPEPRVLQKPPAWAKT